MTVHAPVAAKGRTLIVGSTGFIGRFVAEGSLASGRPTFLLVRPGPASPSKALTIASLEDRGAIVIPGSIGDDRHSLEKVLKEYEIEVVISAVGGGCILDQLILVDAIKGAGTVKRRVSVARFRRGEGFLNSTEFRVLTIENDSDLPPLSSPNH